MTSHDAIPQLPTGSLHVEPAKDGTGHYWVGHWRWQGRHVKRRLGRAHVAERPKPDDSRKGWQRTYLTPKGRPGISILSERAALALLTETIAKHAADLEARETEALVRAERESLPTFRQAGQGWLKARKAQTNAKKKTLDDWASMLRDEDDEPRLRGRKPSARLMRAFGDRRIDGITAQEVTAFLDELDDFGLAPRTINKYRSVIAGIYKWAAREDTYNLQYMPVTAESKRRESDPGELIIYSPEQVHTIARALRQGVHRGSRMRAGGEHSKPEHRAARASEDAQDATAVIVAAFAGLRLGELVALRWRDVDFAAERIRVQRAVVMGEMTSTKGRKLRSVPMSSQVAEALAALGQRADFTGADDYVLCTANGEFIDGGALGRRYKRARDAVRASDASIPALRWHDLRHTFGSLCAAAGVDVVSLQAWMGHSSIKTTMRYLHYAPNAGDAARLSAAFGGTSAKALAA